MGKKIKENSAVRTVYFSVAGNILLALIKIISGLIGNSSALIADGVESTADILASLIVLAGFKLAFRPPDHNHPYGHGKVEPLVTFAVTGFLLAAAAIIAYQSIINIQSPQTAPEPWTLAVLAGIILWKEFSFQLVIRKSRHLKSTSLRAEAWHHRSDGLTSVMAFLGIGAALILGPGYEAAEDWAALAAAGFIVYHSYQIFRPALGEIMDEHNNDLVEEIRKISTQVEGIIGTEKCFIRKAGLQYHLDLHAVVDKHITVLEGHDLAHHLENHLRENIPALGNVIVHVEPDEDFREVY